MLKYGRMGADEDGQEVEVMRDDRRRWLELRRMEEDKWTLEYARAWVVIGVLVVLWLLSAWSAWEQVQW